MKHENEADPEWCVACDAKDLEGEELLECTVDGVSVLLVQSEEKIFACEAICPHMDEPLAHGFCEGKMLTCSMHLWQWDLETGSPVGIASERLLVVPVRVEQGKIFVKMKDLRAKAG
ncbi:Rieske (2Fe-2S) protein [Lacisediminimonas profundi]|uniref:Rieske (2Fe-2S) protein n=1 Tax=Lacisediminimonas profundi TaxID=2603856 RepID=UPI00124B5772|nr:Rieske 2Fe-2S domain-containing protein [Lacisediminimonas profundi]